MKYYFWIILTILLLLTSVGYSQDAVAENDTITKQDSLAQKLNEFQNTLKDANYQRIADSINMAQLRQQLSLVNENQKLKKNQLQAQLDELARQDSLRTAKVKEEIRKHKAENSGFPVVPFADTLFTIYNRLGASQASERATNISKKIRTLYQDDFLAIDSITASKSELTVDVIYKDMIITSISDLDALWQNKPIDTLANEYMNLIKESIANERAENSVLKLLTRIGLIILILLGLWLLLKGINKLHSFFRNTIFKKKDLFLKELSYKDYTFLTEKQELTAILFGLKAIRLFVIVLILFLAMPLMFSIFPFTRGWAEQIFTLILTPFKSIFLAVWKFLPNLVTILAIYFVMRYFIKFVKYIFTEIDAGKLVLSGFHADWAMPTFAIVRVLLYAFMFVIIFPYLPGSDSNVFKGVSVFLGVLFSLGSSSAIANMVAGLVITYMRPFKIGDRIKIGDMVGDVIEKTMLVTRLRTIKNEEITIPNSAVLSGNTTNYSTFSQEPGLIIQTTITIGYDVPWRDMHEALIEAANRAEFLKKEPKPFVFQTSLDDFYVAYQINAYTNEASKQISILSALHQNIQDVCNERGIEILSPHYRAQRDGNTVTIPSGYLKEDYEAPSFRVTQTK